MNGGPVILADEPTGALDSQGGKEVLAILESREIAEAKSEYAAVQMTNASRQELFERDKALWDKNPRLGGVREGGSPVGGHPFARFSRNSFWRGLAMISWNDFFESKHFGASFTGLVSVETFQIAGVNSHSTFALTLLIVIGYWLAIDKPRN